MKDENREIVYLLKSINFSLLWLAPFVTVVGIAYLVTLFQ